MGSEQKIPDGWMKLSSKSRPGKFYYYNKEKKLSVWRVEDCQNAVKVIAFHSKNKTPKKSPQKQPTKVIDKSKVIKKNIAEERMKKLKKELVEDTKRGNNNEIIKNLNLSKNLSGSCKKQDIQKSVPKEATTINEKSLNNSNYPPEESMEVDELSQKSQETILEEEEEEPMDWEEINENEAVQEVHNVRSKTNELPVAFLKTSVEFGTKKMTMSLENEFIIIIDTNVLLSNLKFVREIKGMNFKGLGKCIIYIPYVVLCELDRLKMREPNIARQARAAINFINKCFSVKDEFIIGQSALESSQEIIPIENGDDYIINTGLQVKNDTKKFIILSNDTNLRNKASVNGMQAFSSDMLNYEDFNTERKIKFL
ncbi:hypothetical protein PVAND_013618 [Polypedilum vanderplanki]|uniref:WW domain-containing protein n=1 Tax=Polypedilum vanderplanki TaxID=319348 RepID=A0A9J6CR93_POLVA|nr:hypothetical protein PVAND_013618 [Polypedilum vanderplanki]